MSDELRVTPEVMALEADLQLCGYAGECNYCESPEGRSWARVCRGMDFEEISFYVCEKCLPSVHKEYLHDIAAWEAYAESEIQNRENP